MIAEGPESRWREFVYEQKVPSEEEKEAPPPGSKLALWRLGACGLSLYSRHRQGPATRQREEGLRAFNLLVGGVKPPDLGGSTFYSRPVQVLVVVLLVRCLSCVLFWL